jgi:hypothetical protein
MSSRELSRLTRIHSQPSYLMDALLHVSIYSNFTVEYIAPSFDMVIYQIICLNVTKARS